ncbi:hypothetical protein EI94DRAFT_1704707 [Lactarius quietus]|nr:hypothetical protein EI94DRAFT_1704707 [Lactarius quietus]
MSSHSQTLASSSQFKSILDVALSEYKKKTGNDLSDNDNWLTKELQGCNTVEAVMGIIQDQAEPFDMFRNGDKNLMKWIGSSVFPHAKLVFAAIGYLLKTTKAVGESHDALVDLFQRVQFFIKRLGVHTQISPTDEMVDMLANIMAEVITILSIATKEMQQSRAETYLKKLTGRKDIEDALKRLDSLTREEFQMAIVQVLMRMR